MLHHDRSEILKTCQAFLRPARWPKTAALDEVTRGDTDRTPYRATSTTGRSWRRPRGASERGGVYVPPTR